MAELVPAKQKIDTIRGFLEKSKPQIAMALPKHMNADRLARIAMTSILRNPRLLECSPQSLVGAVIQCSQLGLEPDDIRGEAYLVPFRNNKKGTVDVQLIAGFKGLMDLARRSGKITAIYAEVVHVKDTFSYRLGTEQFLHHIKSDDINPGEVIKVYALARFPNNQCQFIVLSMADVDKSRQRSKAQESGPWVTDFEAMAKKTALRQLCKYLPSSVELATAVALDERAEAGIPQDLEVFMGEVIETEAVKTNGDKKGLADLTQKLKDKTPPPQPTTGTVGEPQVEGAGQPVGGNKSDPEDIAGRSLETHHDPVAELLSDIALMSTRAGINEMQAQLNARLKKAGITGNKDISRITVALSQKKAALAESQEKKGEEV